MNTTLSIPRRTLKTLALAAAVSCVLAACASTPQSPEGAAEVRSKLTRLQSDPNLADRAPLALQEAETAVRIAEEPVGKDVALGAHRVYFADRKVEIAIAQASTRYAEDQREKLAEERERARLAARTREADRARADADAARAGAADAARVASADAARAADAAGAAALEAAELQRQIDELQAKETDRGLVLTLGDVLFTSGQADLKAGVASNLGRLATFLHQNPGRNVEIEGHTDSVGSDEYNQALSQRRADSVRSFLIQQGIGPERIRTAGKGEHQPVADNESSGGRQQNRRVEVIIENPRPATASN
ncbi:MAG TPA: OmpA family protein [Steroidobacteraceae bacterium]|nr:OmpA family protein [Steroidobacteraceae bacterium]